jgi:CBS-domain-containing membrane protein
MISKIKTAFAELFAGGKLKGNGRYVALQCLLVFGALGAVLALYELFGGIIVASLGASSFILFATPHTQSSKAKNLIGGYICGAFSGVLFSYLHSVFMFDFSTMHLALIVGCAAAAALTMFLMVWAGVAHPPAAALALGLASNAPSLITAAAAVLGVCVLCMVRRVLRKYLKNLV